jgi:hypothetical protein
VIFVSFIREKRKLFPLVLETDDMCQASLNYQE